MLPPDLAFLIGYEECEQRLRALAQQRFARAARIQLARNGRPYWHLAGWVTAGLMRANAHIQLYVTPCCTSLPPGCTDVC